MKKNPFDEKYGRKWLNDVLQSDVLTVNFEKKDGTLREMRCTLMESKIPNEKKPNGVGKTKSDDALPVFDVEKQEWRSFRFDSIRSVTWNVDNYDYSKVDFQEGM